MRMRTVRSVVLGCVFLVMLIVSLSTITDKSSSSPLGLQSIVTHTHNHINNLHNNIKVSILFFLFTSSVCKVNSIGLELQLDENQYTNKV